MNLVYIRNVEELTKEKKFWEITKKSLRMLKPSITRMRILVIISLIMVIPIINCIDSNKTTITIVKCIELSNDIIKDLFAINFTGYALFQALASSNTLKQLLSSNGREMSVFKEYNLFFFGISILYVVIILTNYLGLMILNMMDLSSVDINNTLKYASIFVTFNMYIIINAFAIIEIKSFILNMYNCFNISAVTESIKALNEEYGKDD
ncbi:MAG: hypothetical protein RR851_07930 [Clostridium sp.]